MKKVLVIAPYQYLPWFSGGQKFIGLFLQHLAKETELTVISVPANEEKLVAGYKLLPWLKPGFARYYDQSLVRKITALIKKEGFQAIVWEHPYMWWLAGTIRGKTGVPCYIHTHNIEFQRFKSMGKWWWPVLNAYEKNAFRKADGIFFITPEDKQFAIEKWKVSPDKCQDLPYGIEADTEPEDRTFCRVRVAARYGIEPMHRIYTFNGLLSYKPNYDAVRHILEDIDPILQKQGLPYRILICGKDLPEDLVRAINAKKHIIYAGFTERIDEYVKASDILLNPVLTGGGIKTKMVEAIGWGTSVVSTRSGAIGMDQGICGNKLQIVPDNDWQAFSRSILDGPGISESTPAAYYEYYNWKKIVKRIAARF